MSWFSNLPIRLKLIIGFSMLIVAMIISGVSGYSGMTVNHDSVIQISEQNAPTVDAANQLESHLLKGQTLIQEIDARTTVTASNATEEALSQLISRFAQTNTQFDEVVGKLVDGQNNEVLKRLVNEADALHNSEFQPLARELIEIGHKRLTTKAELDELMSDMESQYEEGVGLADTAETEVKSWVEKASGLATNDADRMRSVLLNITPYVDMTMELKISLLEARLRLEEVVQQNTLEIIGQLWGEYEKANADFDELITAALQGGEVDGEVVPALEAGPIRSAIEKLDAVHSAFQATSKDLVSHQRLLLDHAATAQEVRTKLFKAETEVAGIVREIKALTVEQMDGAKVSATDQYKSSITWLFGIVILAALVGILVGWIISQSVSVPLGRAVELAKQVASGDLTARAEVSSSDETGTLLTALNGTSDKLAQIVAQIVKSTEQLASTTTDVAAVTVQTAQNIESQQEQLNQTSVAMNEMSATVQDVAQNASSAASSAAKADEEARHGRQVVERVNASISELATDIEVTKNAIVRLNQETENVGNILEVITSVAEQTNLLALNAAIEAARAGEHGRGFAVVADEVRTLANRTQNSATEIRKLITNLQHEAAMSVQSMELGYQKTGVTVEMAKEAEQALLHIVDAVAMINDQNLQIASAAEEQSAVAEQINGSIVLINDVSSQNSAGAQRIATSTSEVSQLAETLKKLVGEFKVV